MKRTKLKKKSKNPLPKLHGIAWGFMSELIRKRDLDKGCITCGKKFEAWNDPKWQAGHWIHRNSLDFHLGGAVNGQCSGCNMAMQFSHINGLFEAYRKAIDERWGVGTAEVIYQSRNQDYKPTRGLFEGIAVALREKIEGISQ